jgi:hypothetical protein
MRTKIKIDSRAKRQNRKSEYIFTLLGLCVFVLITVFSISWRAPKNATHSDENSTEKSALSLSPVESFLLEARPDLELKVQTRADVPTFYGKLMRSPSPLILPAEDLDRVRTWSVLRHSQNAEMLREALGPPPAQLPRDCSLLSQERIFRMGEAYEAFAEKAKNYLAACAK